MAVRKARKLLSAAVGVATVSYVAGCGRTAAEEERNGRQISSDTSSEDGVSGVNGTSGTSGADYSSTTDFNGGTGMIAGNLVAPPVTPTTTPVPTSTTIGPTTEPWTTVEPWDSTTTPWTSDPPDSSWIAGNLVAPSSYPYPTEPPDFTSEGPQTQPGPTDETGPVGTTDPTLSSGGGTESVPSPTTDVAPDTASSEPNVTGSPVPSGDLDAGVAPDASLGGGAGQ
jgi:hypothetical protein